MLSPVTISLIVMVVVLGGLSAGLSTAQEELQTPSQKTEEALDKLGHVPSVMSKSFERFKGAVGSKFQKGAGSKVLGSGKAEADDLPIAANQAEQTEAARLSAQRKRDPFRPATMRPRHVSRTRENLSPLERFELGQLKVVGVVWDVQERRAMIEDSGGLGYIVKVGTPIGVNEGKIKTIGRNEIVIEEFYEDNYGARKKRDVNMRLASE